MESTLKFLREHIDDGVQCEDWQYGAREKLSLSLAGAFDYHKVRILGERMLMIRPKADMPLGKIQKMAASVREKTGMECVMVLREASPYMIKKMLMDRAAFIVPGKQLSLPFLAMHIKNTKEREARDIRKFTPGTQMIYLCLLYRGGPEFSQDDIIDRLDISAMTAARGLGDLASLGLVTYKIAGKTGRKKVYSIPSKAEFYREGKRYLDNPVRGILYVDEMPGNVPAVKSDLTALAEQTMLVEPEQKRFALYSRDRTLLDGHIVPRDRAMQEALPQVQLMKYNVCRLSTDGYVDPVTLELGIADKDERIEMALEELMEGREWYEG